MFGCGIYADPNDIKTAIAPDRVEIARNLLQSTSEILDYQVQKKKLSDEQRLSLIAEEAERLLTFVDQDQVIPADKWKYAELLRATGRFEAAIPVYEEAVKKAPNWDRRVNDSLRLAQCYAKAGKVKEAITLARTTLKAPDTDTAPILPATLYELVPSAEGKGMDKELGKLLVDAIAAHRRTKVDMNTDAGKGFVAAGRFHINRAQQKAMVLLGQSIQL